MYSSADYFSENGPIAANLENYEVRAEQIKMVETVEEAIAADRHLIVEAGTGVGKSLAYLVPFILWAVRENKKVVISTYTKALQDQLFVKDLAFLKKALGIDFRYAKCVGSENYVCLRKASKKGSDLETRKRELFLVWRSDPSRPRGAKKRSDQSSRIIRWLAVTETGLATDMDFVPDVFMWNKFSRESDLCLGRKCGHYGECFFMRSRKEQAKAHILIANHSLLFADIASGGKALPAYQALVLDEAHMVEDIATDHFGEIFSGNGLRKLAGDIEDLFKDGPKEKDSPRVKSKEAVRISFETELFKNEVEAFSAKVATSLGSNDNVTAFSAGEFLSPEMLESLGRLSAVLRGISVSSGDEDISSITGTYAERCAKFSSALEFVCGPREGGYVYWADVKAHKSGIYYAFHAAPIDVSSKVKESIFQKISPVVLTSATLSSGGGKGSFSFIKSRLGADDCLELRVGSPFDFSKNVLMYVPGHISDPNQDMAGFVSDVTDDVIRLYDIMKGRIFALFTSYDMLYKVSGKITEKRPDINMLRQGDLPRYVLLDVFKKTGDSILMGTMTFWQGVDVPGNALECVIITKLPFAVPTDPINSARIDFLKQKGHNPFKEYQLPRAVIMFKQGFGRLIRTKTDRGVVAILDPRVRSRYYGSEFIKAVPKCEITSDIKDVAEFFSQDAEIQI